MSTSLYSTKVSGLGDLSNLSVDPSRAVSASFLQLLLPNPTCAYIDVDGPIAPEDSLIVYDAPFAPSDPAYSLKLRRALKLPPEPPAVDPNVRVVLDSFIKPRRWRDPAKGVVLVQHASPAPALRTDTVATHERLRQRLSEVRARATGICPARTLLVAECFLEAIRQVVCECWERGLLLLHVHAERVAAQAAHRELFESRVGHSFRLALKGEKDTSRVQEDMRRLRERVAALEAEEAELRERCDAFAAESHDKALIAEKQHNDVMAGLRREGLIKRSQLEALVAPPPPGSL